MDKITKEEYEKIQAVFEDNGFRLSKLLSGSKSFYRSKFPENKVYFNANIFIEGIGKVWYGDLDITLDSGKLQEIANQIKKPFFVLSEMDGRFEFQDRKDYKTAAKASFYPEE